MISKSILSFGIALGSSLLLNAQETTSQSMSANAPANPASTASTDEAQLATAIIEQSKEIFVTNQDNAEKRIPDEILAEARSVLIMHVTRGAIGIGASEGRGIATHNNIDNWSPPAFYHITSGSLGIQLAARQTNIIALFMTDKATELLYKSEFQWGVGVNIQAGPVGGDVSLNSWRGADILVYDTIRPNPERRSVWQEKHHRS
jgi:lipid-binding SYLF domain-containing protein